MCPVALLRNRGPRGPVCKTLLPAAALAESTAAAKSTSYVRIALAQLELADIPAPFPPALDPGTPGYVKALNNGCAGGEGR
jgi:hypothetical protein